MLGELGLFREFIDSTMVKLSPVLNTAIILRREETLKFVCFLVFTANGTRGQPCLQEFYEVRPSGKTST